MRIVPNPAKEAINRRKHGFSFARVGEIMARGTVDYWDDRPLWYDHEGRIRVFGHLDDTLVVLIFEPIQLGDDEFAVRPISLRKAEPRERREYERMMR